ncbi:MAG: sulfurtransferase TusA family protein [Deltaproteobacteria bacterium]|nr:sulfurtransferase TusA family protein [Deltaproteobacteria bacterium]
MSDAKPDLELDCRGMNCPLPILKTKKAIDTLKTGQILKMIATDPGSINDMNAWTNSTGNALVESEQSGKEFVFYIRKK